jgi:hypothetical protein
MWKKTADYAEKIIEMDVELEVDYEKFMRLHAPAPTAIPGREELKSNKYVGFQLATDKSKHYISPISFYVPGYGGFCVLSGSSSLRQFVQLMKDEGITLVHYGSNTRMLADLTNISLPSINTRNDGCSLAVALGESTGINFHLVDIRYTIEALLNGKCPLQSSFSTGMQDFSLVQEYYLIRNALGPLLLLE